MGLFIMLVNIGAEIWIYLLLIIVQQVINKNIFLIYCNIKDLGGYQHLVHRSDCL